MASNANARMIVIPYKRTYELNITQPIKEFINNAYPTNNEEFKLSVDSLNQLRTEALFRSARQDKLAKMMRYYDQLVAIETKIPISENQIRIPFKWQDAFDRGSLFVGKSTFTLSSNLYERLCVLYNIGACCSELAGTQHLDQEEGLKTALKLYQQAASAFSFIRDNALTATRNDCTFDLYPETLNLLSSLMLAQAQEIFYEKAVRDKMKDLTISKIAAQCSDYYADALKALQVDYLKDNIQKQWIGTISGKQALFHSLAEYHRSLFEESEKNFGNQIARLTKSLELIKIAVDRSGKESSTKTYASAIQQAYDKAQKENDFVYHERVPEYKLLSGIERAQLAKVTPLKFPLSEDFRDLFANMVPLNVYTGLQTFNAKRLEATNLEIGKLRQATDLLNGALSTWNLPAAIEDVGNAGSNKVPQSLLDKSHAIKEKGGITQVDRFMSDLPSLLQRNTEILNETKRILEDEERSDNELRSQLKEKWTRTASKQLNESLFNEIKQYESMVENAIKANKVIDEKYYRHRDAILLLSKSEHEIASSLPAANAVAALQNTHIIKDLKRLMNDVEGLRNVREVLESELKGVDSDSIKAKLISVLQASNGLDEHSIIQNELDSLLNPLRKQVRENIQEQEKLLGYIEKANSEFTKEKVVNETSKLRDEMLKNLAAAHDGFIELFNNLQEGSQFYNELTPILVKLQSKISDFVFARKTEKDDLMKDIQTTITRQSITDTKQQAHSQSSSSSSQPTPPARPSYPASTNTAPAPGQNNPPPYPMYNSPYLPQIPTVYYPYSFYPPQPVGPPQPQQQQGANPFLPYPQQPYPQYPQMPGQQQQPPQAQTPPSVPPRRGK